MHERVFKSKIKHQVMNNPMTSFQLAVLCLNLQNFEKSWGRNLFTCSQCSQLTCCRSDYFSEISCLMSKVVNLQSFFFVGCPTLQSRELSSLIANCQRRCKVSRRHCSMMNTSEGRYQTKHLSSVIAIFCY